MPIPTNARYYYSLVYHYVYLRYTALDLQTICSFMNISRVVNGGCMTIKVYHCDLTIVPSAPAENEHVWGQQLTPDIK